MFLTNQWRMAICGGGIIMGELTWGEIRSWLFHGDKRGWRYNGGQCSGGPLYTELLTSPITRECCFFAGCQAGHPAEWDACSVPPPGALHPDLCSQTLLVPVPGLWNQILWWEKGKCQEPTTPIRYCDEKKVNVGIPLQQSDTVMGKR